MIKNLIHVSIAVKSLDEALSVFENLLGLKAAHIEEVPLSLKGEGHDRGEIDKES